MSKLTEYQIRALIPGMEATAARYEEAGRPAQARRTRAQLEAYRAELANFEKTAQIEQSAPQQVAVVSTKRLTKTAQVEQFLGGSMDKRNALEIAADNVAGDPERLLEVGKWVGRHQAFGMIAAKCSAAQAQSLKRLKDSAEYKALDMTWDQFCNAHLGISRPTADRIIANFEEFGAAYFNLATVTRISPTSFRQIAGAVSDTEIEIAGEKVPITKTHAARIAEAIESLRKTVEQKEEQVQEKVRDNKKLREERDNAKKAAEREHQALLEYKKAQAERFPNADDDFKVMLDAQSHFDLAMAKLASVGNRELSTENEARYIGACEYFYRQLIQATFDARQKFGKGWNMADPNDMLSLDQAAPDARNLMSEYVDKNRK